MYNLLNKVWESPLETLENINKKLLINTLNTHSFNIAKKDTKFKEALLQSDILLPDGIGIVYALKLLLGKNIKKISGSDLFHFEMNRLNLKNGRCFFMGSSEKVLGLIEQGIKLEYPNVIAGFYSPPYKPDFSDEENDAILNVVNSFEPEVLFVGMTAPKQEKWSYEWFEKINAKHVCSIGAVFDFVAGSIKRAPNWMINLGFEWFYRLIREPKRMWRRYVLGSFRFISWIFIQSFKKKPISKK